MGGATYSTSGTRSPGGRSSLRGSRSREGEILFRSLLRFILPLANSRRFTLFGESLIGNRVPYKGLLVFSHILLINGTNLQQESEISCHP